MAWLAVTVVLLEGAPRRPLGLDLYRPTVDGNPLMPRAIELGRRLFHERRLSRDGSMACSSCHDPRRAFTNGTASAAGVGGARGRRNVPTIVNRAWGRSFFWDGRAPTLEAQVLQPILDPAELAMSAGNVVALANSPAYRDRFAAAFGHASPRLPSVPGYRGVDPAGLSGDDATTLHQVASALAAYVRTIQSGDSPYDRYVQGDRSALDESAARGLRIFRGKGGCSGCHVGPLLSDEAFHNTGVAWRSGTLADEGRARVTGMAADRGAFKTPTLREVARTAPYMHDGSFAILEDVVEYYDRGGAQNPALDNRLRPLNLTSSEKRDLSSFLNALSGRIHDRE
jgi:cytochrome c peroxidase